MSVALSNRVSLWKSFFLWATRIRWLFSIYLPIFLLWLYRRVLCRLQKVSSFFRCSDTRVPFRSIFLISTSCFKESISQNKILSGHLHFFIKHRTYAKQWVCLHQFSSSRWLLLEHHNCWYRTGPKLPWVRVQVSEERSMFVLQPGRFGW